MSKQEVMDKENFKKFAEYDKRLLDLEQTILEHTAAHEADEVYCANAYWYGCVHPYNFHGGFKGELLKIVGWGAEVEELRSSEVYDICYRYLYSLLRDCKHEGMFCM